MRVALLQVELDPKGRAANLQRLLASIRRAAKEAPAPDFLILPGLYDVAHAGPQDRGRRAMYQIVRETLSWQARDWGVYIAAGLHHPGDSTWTAASVLFDPDGDEFVAASPGSEPRTSASLSTVVSCETVVGRIGVAVPSVSLDDLSREAWIGCGAFVAVPTYPAGEGGTVNDSLSRIRAWQAKLGRRTQIFWGVVAPAHDDDARSRGRIGNSSILDPSGNVVAAAGTLKERIVFAEVEMVPQAYLAAESETALDGHAT